MDMGVDVPDQAPVAPDLKILVVDDEAGIRDMLTMSLKFVGYRVVAAGSGNEAFAVAELERPDLAILDVMLPDIDGFTLLKRLRAAGHDMPAIFLTARDAIEDRLNGLTLGGDDYISKPFSLEEVILRVGVVLRRTATTDHVKPNQLTYADLVLDEDRHQVWRADQLIELSPTEFALLRFLLRNAGHAMSRAQILDHVWHYDFNGNSGVVDSYIRYLRRKMDTFDPPLIQTIRGVGYSLRVADTR
jgi:two-component system, OmpR family, response regulator